MNTLKLTSQFKKDLKRYKYKIMIIDKLEVLLKLLENGQPIPAENKPHILTAIIVVIWNAMSKVTHC